MDETENKKTKNVSYHRPYWDASGCQCYSLVSHPIEEDRTSVCLVVAERVIPVIFIPGVMGSNLKNSEREVWRYSFGSLKKWLFAGPEQRKKLLDPNTTQVDESGDICNNHADGNKFPSRRDRGWGAAFYLSYGEALDRLQYLLCDEEVLLDNYFTEEKQKTIRQQFIGVDLGAEKGEAPLTEAEVRHSHKFLFPLHVFGYNWLASNADSAKQLGDYITRVLTRDYAGRLAVKKVILVTHSMGGLVARHYSEKLAGRENILGMVHGVMPDLGSPTAYRRMKTGERGLLGQILGPDAAHLMPVLAQSPGPLQLLPGTDYGGGWLKIKHPDGSVEHKPESDPYEEIYLNDSDWWRLGEKALLIGIPRQEWLAFKDRIKQDVMKFIEGLQGNYHPHTWAFYGASDGHPSDDTLEWRVRPDPRPVLGLPVLPPTSRQHNGKVFELTSTGGRGDGTVPVRSGKIAYSRVQSLLATDVDHEGAFAINPQDRALSVFSDLSNAILFTLRAIVKIVQQVPAK